jgi:hypothetical protein
MRKPLLIAGTVLLFLSATLSAQQKLKWQSSFIPAWSNGNKTGHALDVGGYSLLNCDADFSITGGGTFEKVRGTMGPPSPSVIHANFTVPGSTERIQFSTDFTGSSSYSTIQVDFTSAVTNLSFKIADIDKESSTSNTYFDKVTVTGTYGTTIYNPAITKYDALTDPNFLILSGNSAQVNTTSGEGGDAASDATDQRGTINVDFAGTSITSITMRFENASGVTADPDIQIFAVGSFSFVQSILPVILSRFTANRIGQDVRLDWTTAQEMNSSLFNIEKSGNGQNWETIGTVAASGNSNSEINYYYTDRNPAGDVLFYRLKEKDIDGKYKYSSITKISSASMLNIQVYPNPFTDNITLILHSNTEQLVNVVLTDITGKQVKAIQSRLFTGNNNILLSRLDDLPTGIYYLEIRNNEGLLLDKSKIIK